MFNVDILTHVLAFDGLTLIIERLRFKKRLYIRIDKLTVCTVILTMLKNMGIFRVAAIINILLLRKEIGIILLQFFCLKISNLIPPPRLPQFLHT